MVTVASVAGCSTRDSTLGTKPLCSLWLMAVMEYEPTTCKWLLISPRNSMSIGNSLASCFSVPFSPLLEADGRVAPNQAFPTIPEPMYKPHRTKEDQRLIIDGGRG